MFVICSAADSSPVVVYGPALKGHAPDNLQAFRVGGDSMEPLIADGGIVLADIRYNEPKHLTRKKQVFVVCLNREDEECSVKYLNWGVKDESVLVQSANDFYEAEVRRVEDIIIIGRVIWAWREF